jgi:hypothetical protein
MLTVKSNDGVTSSRNTAESLTDESADEIRSPAPRFVVWAGPLESLRSVTVSAPPKTEINAKQPNQIAPLVTVTASPPRRDLAG